MLLQFFPEDEEKIAQAALQTFDAQPARRLQDSQFIALFTVQACNLQILTILFASLGAGSVKRVGRGKQADKTDSEKENGEENGSNVDSGDVDSGLDSVFASFVNKYSMKDIFLFFSL